MLNRCEAEVDDAVADVLTWHDRQLHCVWEVLSGREAAWHGGETDCLFEQVIDPDLDAGVEVCMR